MVLRDRDANTAWEDEADGTLEERVYYCQNWRADVSAILTATGKMVEWVKYSAYGVPFALPAGDTNSDGDWDATDAAAILNSSSYDVRQDAELDGDVDSSDAVHAHSITGAYQTLGRGVLSSAAVNNRRGYAGYEYDPTFEGAERWLYHVRHRVYDAEVGRWTRRDPLGYVDGMSLYEYVEANPLALLDAFGLAGTPPCATCIDPPVSRPPVIEPPVRPSPVTPGPIWVPDKTPWWKKPIKVTPGPNLTPRQIVKPGPLGLCILTFCGFYCLGEQISPHVIRPIDPIIPLPPGTTIDLDPDDPCKKAKDEKKKACGAPGVPSPPWSPRGLPPRKGMPGDPLRRWYCEAIDNRLGNAQRCLAARRKVTDLCYGGETDDAHAAEEERIQKSIDALNDLKELFCSGQNEAVQ
ncbi:MAG: hypothetical protein KIS87_12570 [Phycisphaeraceae bacterium]|nr:hypothetical protein [Phycisphaeraceae bacterium]